MSGDSDADGPALRVVGTWRDGTATTLSEEAWEAVAAGFLGCGFRVTVPVRRGAGDALAQARELAGRVAGRLGVGIDPAAWDGLARTLVEDGPEDWQGVVVLGGWGYGIGRDFGPAWTRAVAGLPMPREVRTVETVTLPWRWSSRSPTAGLPMISALEEARASEHLDERGAGAGLWTDAADRVVTGTAGPLLVERDGRWVFPDPATGVVPQWLHSCMAAALGAEPGRVAEPDLRAGRVACMVSPLGDLLLAGGVGAGSDEDLVRALVAARDRALPA